jgi:thiol-disulfide isomerase/thioredoxin
MTGAARLTTMRAFVILALLAGSASADVLKVGDKVAELDVATDEAGKSYKLKSLKGKWVVLTVGASWCKPCKKELPTWDKMAANMKGKDVVFVAVNVDNDIADGKKFNKQLGLKNMKVVYMPQEKSAASARYGAETMPTTFVFDPNQVVKFRKDGFTERDADGEYKKFRAELDKLIK